MNKKIIIGIETSFDDFSVALLEDRKIIVMWNENLSGTMWKDFGGVIPKLIIKKGEQAIKTLTKILKKFLNDDFSNIKNIFVTVKPGIEGCLKLGKAFALSLGEEYNIPVFGIDHLLGHFYSNFLNNEINLPNKGLYAIFSGGNSKLYVYENNSFSLLSETRDIALGSMLDKIARELNFSNAIEMDSLQEEIDFNLILPKIQLKKGNMHDFSFTGLETFFKHFVKNDNNNFSSRQKANIVLKGVFLSCAQHVKKVLQVFNIKNLILGGGVSANLSFRRILIRELQEDIEIIVGNKEYSTDNGAMIALAGVMMEGQLEQLL